MYIEKTFWISADALRQINDGGETPDTFVVSSSTFSFCAVNRTYDAYATYFPVKVVVDDTKTVHEECDCGNRTQHNDGGNYHYTYYSIADPYPPEGRVNEDGVMWSVSKPFFPDPDRFPPYEYEDEDMISISSPSFIASVPKKT